MRTERQDGLVRRRAGAVLATLAAAAAVGLAPVSTPSASAITGRFDAVTVGHSSSGTLLTTTQDFAYSGILELVRDDGTTAWRRTLDEDPSLGGISVARNLSMCADSITSQRADYDQETGRTTRTVLWSTTGSTAHGSVVLGADEYAVSAAPGGWVVQTFGPGDGETTLTLHRPDGSRLTLGTIAGRVATWVCDDDALVVGTSRYATSTAVVRVPFDGSGPVAVVTEPADDTGSVVLQPLSVDGSTLAVRRYPSDAMGESATGPESVDRYDGTTRTTVLDAAAGVRVEGGGVSSAGTLVCTAPANLAQGCDLHWFPVGGVPVEAASDRQSGLFWAVDGGFVQGCTGTYGGCTDLYHVAVPSLATTTFHELRVPLAVGRWGGADRYAVAAGIADRTASHSSYVFLASGETFADALSAGAPGARFRFPVLLTRRDTLPAATAAALADLDPYRVIVLGGPASVSETVAAKAAAQAQTVRRISGADRYEVAANVSREFVDPGVDTVYVVSGEVYPDGLVASVPAARASGSVLLTRAHTLPGSTKAELERLDPAHVVVVGGTSSIGPEVVAALEAVVGKGAVRRISGADRYAVAAAVAHEVTGDERGRPAFLATGTTFADALSLAPATLGANPILLTRPTALPAATATELQRMRAGGLTVAGGTASVSNGVIQQVRDLPDLPPDVP